MNNLKSENESVDGGGYIFTTSSCEFDVVELGKVENILIDGCQEDVHYDPSPNTQHPTTMSVSPRVLKEFPAFFKVQNRFFGTFRIAIGNNLEK